MERFKVFVAQTLLLSSKNRKIHKINHMIIMVKLIRKAVNLKGLEGYVFIMVIFMKVNLRMGSKVVSGGNVTVMEVAMFMKACGRMGHIQEMVIKLHLINLNQPLKNKAI